MALEFQQQIDPLLDSYIVGRDCAFFVLILIFRQLLTVIWINSANRIRFLVRFQALIRFFRSFAFSARDDIIGFFRIILSVFSTLSSASELSRFSNPKDEPKIIFKVVEKLYLS